MDGRDLARGALRSALAYWTDFIARCLSQRLEPGRFEAYARAIYAQHQLSPVVIADLFLRPQASNRDSLDPRVPPYLQILSRLGYVDTPSILRALYRYSSSHAQLPAAAGGAAGDRAGDTAGGTAGGTAGDIAGDGGGELPEEGDGGAEQQRPRPPVVTRWQSSYWAEEVIFYRLTKTVVEGSAVQDPRAALDVVKVISKWMSLFTAASGAFAASAAADVLGQMQDAQVRDEMESARAAFVALLLRLCESDALYRSISKPFAKDARKELSDSLASFVPTLQLVPQITEKLELFRTETLAKLDPVDKRKQAANAAMDELLDSTVGLDNFIVPEIPVMNTRAGLYIYLNASLVGRPLMDDAALFSYLSNRYQGDVQSIAVDLILASFDVLANAVFRNEGQRDAHLLRSFLSNKVPLLLCQLCPPAYSTASAEFCITQALSQIDTSLFPTASLMFDESRNNNPYTESVREEFCGACVLHGLVERENMERILGEVSMSYESSLEKYFKDKLVQDCLSDPEKIQGLVRELDKMDGNVGAVCQALVELMRQLCNNKETTSLKLLCGQLAQRPQSLDVLLLFEKLPTILAPLCQLLDNWRYDEDQGEYQPVYEEFCAIMLLVFAFAYRYDLTAADIGIQAPGSCVATILGRAHIGRQLDELSEQETEHLNRWIHGLFDSEAAGLGDDLMSSCPPQDFYLVVASLFQNIVLAYGNGYLTDESLSSGVDFLVDTFLLPSLVPAIRFLSDYLWVDQNEQKSVIKILQLILLPRSISDEASPMLSSVKNLVAKPLEQTLRAYQRRDPKNQDIEPLLRALGDSLPLSRRTGGAEHNELESWSSSPSSGLASAVKHAIQGLVQWSMHPGINIMPTSYTHRQIIAGTKMLGPRRVLCVILEEVRQQSEAGSANIVYDVATALVCAPDVTNEPPAAASLIDGAGGVAPRMQRPLTLREVLKAEAEDCKKIQKDDPALAEIVVRLYRRVEAQLAMPQGPTLLDAGMGLGLDGNSTAALGDAMAAAAAAAVSGGVQGDALAVDTVGLDMGLSSDLGLGSASATGGLDGSGDADLFGLDTTTMDVFDGWDGMDLS